MQPLLAHLLILAYKDMLERKIVISTFSLQPRARLPTRPFTLAYIRQGERALLFGLDGSTSTDWVKFIGLSFVRNIFFLIPRVF